MEFEHMSNIELNRAFMDAVAAERWRRAGEIEAEQLAREDPANDEREERRHRASMAKKS